MKHALLAYGLIFPLLSWVTVVAGAITFAATGKRSSAIIIPFVGPILLSIWVLVSNFPWWVLFVPWILDIGTMMFVWALPQFASEAWRTSTYTRTQLLTGRNGIESAQISLHKGGYYVLKKRWRRKPEAPGIAERSEPGNFEIGGGEEIILTSHTGRLRKLKPVSGGFCVEDTNPEEEGSIDGWTLKSRRA